MDEVPTAVPPVNAMVENVENLSAIEHYRHWWREPVAGGAAILVACVDEWFFAPTKGFSTSLDELLILVGVTLLAGVRNLFGTTIQPPSKPKEPEQKASS
jgi:hypothetical protein